MVKHFDIKVLHQYIFGIVSRFGFLKNYKIYYGVIDIKFKINNLSVYHIHKFQQNSFAQYEEFTASYDVINLQLGGKFNNQFEYAFLINNVFNKEYTPHISRLRGVAGGVPNPGRSFSINLKYNF